MRYFGMTLLKSLQFCLTRFRVFTVFRNLNLKYVPQTCLSICESLLPKAEAVERIFVDE